MLKKVLIAVLTVLNVFTLTNIDAQVPDNYQAIVLDLEYIAGSGDLQAIDIDTQYRDLWSFRNFQDAYIDINGFTVVSDGTAITSANFNFNVQYGQAFELVYSDTAYYFAISELEIPGLNFTVQPNAVIAFRVNGEIDPLPDPLEIVLNLPDTGVVAEPEVSGGFLELLVGYGLYNPTGLLILFAITLIIINVSLAFLKVPSMVYISTNFAIGAGFIFFNLIPVWAGFIFLSVMAMFLILSFKGSSL
jgi:hypothetical protein